MTKYGISEKIPTLCIRPVDSVSSVFMFSFRNANTLTRRRYVMMLGRELTPWQTPLRAINEMQREMNQLFSRFFGEGEHAGTRWQSSNESYVPQIESAVRENTLYLKADLPGIDPKDVEVMVEGNHLTLRGQRKAEHEGPEGGYLHREVQYGSFVRSFTIPEGVKAEDIKAKYQNGVLELAIPLPASVLPKKVNIAIEGQASNQRQLGTTK
jgi:HSP20 family protein